jgi:hypothetical protein
MIDLGVELLGYGADESQPGTSGSDLTQRHIPVRITPYSEQLRKIQADLAWYIEPS